MNTDTDSKKRTPRFLLAMPDELRHAIEREAFTHGRTVTAEINMRLKSSFEFTPASYTAPELVTNHSTAHHTEQGNQTVNIAQEKSPTDSLSEIDRAMLGVLRRMPVEKQLALLSLFK